MAGYYYPLAMKKWLYDSVRDVDQAPIERLRNFPREPDMLVYGLRSLGRADHSRIAAHLSSLRDYRAAKSADEPFVRYGGESLQSSRHTLPARGVAVAQIASCVSSGRGGLFFPKRAATVGGRGSRERVAVCATGARSTKPVRLPRIARQSGNILIIFPEGTRSMTGEVDEFKSGIGALVAGRDVEVRPVSSMDHFGPGRRAALFRVREKFG